MKTRRSIKTMLVVFVLMFALLAAYLIYVIDAYGAYWFSSPYNTRVEKWCCKNICNICRKKYFGKNYFRY